MEKMKMQSENLVNENVEKIAKLFPNCVTEGKDEKGQTVRLVDFDLLKQELSNEVVEGVDERFTFNWAGKKQAILIANAPINATLRPCREESVDFDNTKNLYIEGDNLDVLKLLRETYLNKVKMIYIDPPYNTGHDFVYEDDFASSSEDYLQSSKSYDEQGKQMFQNNYTNGRFHSDWLSMMYSRLKIARDLLTDDGAIFISIDDNEQENLKKICNEIFGENNFVGEVIRKTKSMTGDDGFGFNLQHESLYIYSKYNEKLQLEGEDKDYAGYSNPDNDPNGDWCSADPSAKSGGESTNFGIENPYTKKFDYPPVGRYWAFSKNTLQEYIQSGKIKFKEQYRDNERGFIFKRYKKDASSFKNPLSSLFACSNDYMNQKATIELSKIFDAPYFSYPKPVGFIKYLTRSITKDDDIILDFFSGSSTTAHAVMQLNAEDGRNRKFIMVQLPEKCDEKSEAFKAGYKNICEIGKERIRRAGEKIIQENSISNLQNEVLKQKSIVGQQKNELLINKENVRKAKEELENIKVDFEKIVGRDLTFKECSDFAKEIDNYTEKAVILKSLSEKLMIDGDKLNKNSDKLIGLANRLIQLKNNPLNLDIGFRVLKLDSSNMKDVYYNPADLKQGNLFDLASNIKEDRSAEDLLFQVMLEMGVLLSSEIKVETVTGKKIFNVNDGNLVCCFDENLTDEVVTQIAKMQPLYAVFRDSSMKTDSVAVNFDQIFETYSPTTTRKVL